MLRPHLVSRTWAWSLTGLLATAVAAGSPQTDDPPVAGPLRTWSIDFGDPREPARWELHPPGSRSDQIHWELAPRNAEKPGSDRMLRFTASSDLGVETHHYVVRPFPDGFQPAADHDLVLKWEWMIGDVELSDSVTLGIVVETATGRLLYHCRGVASHSRFTTGWPILFEPSDRWLRRRFVFAGGRPCRSVDEEIVRSVGVFLQFVNPVRQTVGLGRLTVEEWPAGRLEEDPLLRPHRPPPLEEPFESVPLERLRNATAGALEDLDGDGLPELLVLEWRGYARLYRSGPGGPFSEELTGRSGLAIPTMGSGAVFVDLDADRDRDLVVTSEFHVPRLFENRGRLRFVERRLLGDEHLSFWYGAAADDVDRDGWPDLFFVSPIERRFLFLRNRGGWELAPEPLFDPERLHDLGRLSFSASFADADGDGWPDLFLGREELLRNVGGSLRPVAAPWPSVSRARTEGGAWADFDGDGTLDLLVLRDSIESRRLPDPGGETRLLLGDGRGAFTDLGPRAGLPPLESAEVALAEDFDNDGDLDLYLCQRDRPNHLLLNDGQGHFGPDATERAGFVETGGCDAALAGDVDGDGGVDVVILRYGSPPRVLLNRMDRGGWLGVVVEGVPPATDAVGARVSVLDEESRRPIAVRWVRRGRGYGSVGPAELRFGLGEHRRVGVEVRFPGGRTRRLGDVAVGSTVLVREEADTLLSSVWSRAAEARFTLRRGFRRSLQPRPLVPWAIALVALLGGFLAVVSRRSQRARLVLAGALLAGTLLAFALGSTPGRGLAGSPPALWLGGVLFGFAAPLLVQAGGRLRRRLREPAPSIEELARFTLDFRHAGTETRALLALESRAKNLFMHDEVNPRFHAELLRLAERYPSGAGARLGRLAELAGEALPDLEEQAESVRWASEELGRHLGRLAELDRDRDGLGRWQTSVLPTIQRLRADLASLLARIDHRLACNVVEVLDEACSVQLDRLEAAGIRLHVEHAACRDRLAFLPADRLLMILGNLFDGSVAALEGCTRKQIEIECCDLGARIEIHFSDSGPGVPPEHRDRIFDPGFSTRPGGGGYGLARSREVLSGFGGGFELQELEGGACFLIRLRTVTGG